MQYTFLPLSHRTTYLQVAVVYQEMQQCTNEGSEKEDCKQVHIDVNNAGFQMFKTNKCFMKKEVH